MIASDFTIARPLIVLPALAAAIAVLASAAVFLIPAPQVAVEAPAGPVVVSEAAPLRDRSCSTCGFMHAIRRTDPATGQPSYEFSVRMRDGSTRESNGATVGRWIEGDRVMLIGGAAARALEEQKNPAL